MQAETAAGRGSERRTRRVRGAGAAEPVMSKLEENTLNPNGGEFTSLRLLHCAFFSNTGVCRSCPVFLD